MRTTTFHHWLIVAVCCGMAASSIGICVNSLGVFFPAASRELGVGVGAFALQATVSNLVTGFFTPFAMVLLRKYPFRLLVSLGILLAGGSTVLMSMAIELWQFYGLAVVRGMGCSFFALVVITYTIGNWFNRKHGLAVGVTLSFSGLGGAFFSPLFSLLIGEFGWRTAHGISGLFIIALALPGVLLWLDSHPNKKHLHPYGSAETKTVTPGSKKAEAPWDTYTSWGFVALAAIAVLNASVTGIVQFFPGYTQSLGGSVTAGASLVSAAMVGNIVFKLVLGVLSDRMGPINACSLLALAFTSALALLIPLSPVTQFPVTLGLAFVLGAIYAVGAVGTPLLTRRLFGVDRFGAVYPYISMAIGVGSSVSLTIIGFLFDAFHTYQTMLWGGFGFGCVILVLLQCLRKKGVA